MSHGSGPSNQTHLEDCGPEVAEVTEGQEVRGEEAANETNQLGLTRNFI